jgi:small subunit ribosomal protein S17
LYLDEDKHMEIKKEIKKIKRQIVGEVTGNKMDKTVRVATTRTTKHEKYKKVLVRTRTFMAHTDIELSLGDKVTIQECRPYSKNVKWVVIAK